MIHRLEQIGIYYGSRLDLDFRNFSRRSTSLLLAKHRFFLLGHGSNPEGVLLSLTMTVKPLLNIQKILLTMVKNEMKYLIETN